MHVQLQTCVVDRCGGCGEQIIVLKLVLMCKCRSCSFASASEISTEPSQLHTAGIHQIYVNERRVKMDKSQGPLGVQLVPQLKTPGCAPRPLQTGPRKNKPPAVIRYHQSPSTFMPVHMYVHTTCMGRCIYVYIHLLGVA